MGIFQIFPSNCFEKEFELTVSFVLLLVPYNFIQDPMYSGI